MSYFMSLNYDIICDRMDYWQLGSSLQYKEKAWKSDIKLNITNL